MFIVNKGETCVIVLWEELPRVLWIHFPAYNQGAPFSFRRVLPDARPQRDVEVMSSDNSSEFAGDLFVLPQMHSVRHTFRPPHVLELDSGVKCVSTISPVTSQAAREKTHALFPEAKIPVTRLLVECKNKLVC